jgi:hypothetical protein
VSNRAQQIANRKITMARKADRTEPRRDRNGNIRCRVCGCTEVDACADGCGWVQGEADLCTTCAAAADALVVWLESARRPNRAALWREVRRQTPA